MNWEEILYIFVMVLLPVNVGFYFCNRRIDDMNHRISDLRDYMSQRHNEMRKEMGRINKYLVA
ncbi:hypothetical protein H8E88_21435 [candidate division KSB1 bacterium]|nr:hypothetical protein [candidate division KSB1 bacterium]MBL7094092.1 hypothetical protein [candidate division KSB1 bacterium]